MVSSLIIPLEKPIIVGNKEQKYLGVKIYNFDPSFAPEGKTTLEVMFESEFAYWHELSQDSAAYKVEKEKIAVAVVSALNKRFPGLSNQLEMWDVATPVTFYRYTGNWQGSYEGWLPTPRILGRRIPYTLPGLEGFYMAGHWVVPGGGLPSAALAGRYVAHLICDRFGQKFAPRAP